MALAAKDQMTFPRVKAYAEGSGERVKEEIPMIPLANNVQNVWDGSGCLKKRSGHQCLGLLFVVALLCLNPALSAQQLVTSYPLPVPKFVVLGWLYAPMGGPTNGPMNFVSYGQSKAVGSSHSQAFSSSNAQTQTTTTTSGFSLWGFGSQTQNTVSDQWTTNTQNESSISVTSLDSNSLAVQGPQAFVGENHDYDLAVLWMNPVMNTTLTYNPSTTPKFSFLWQGLEYNGCELGNPSDPVNFFQLISGCDPNGGLQPDIVYVPAMCLKNPFSQAVMQMSPSKCVDWWQAEAAKTELYLARSWDQDSWGVDPKTLVPNGPGLTVQDLANILRTNPFITQTLVADNYQKDATGKAENPYTSPCHPTYGLDFNPDEAETIPDSSTFSAPYSGTWPADFCGTPGKMMARMDQQTAVVHYQSSVDNGGGTQRAVQSSLANTATNTYVHSINTTTTSSLDFSASIGLPFDVGGPSLSSSLFSDSFNFSTSSGTGNSWTDVQSWSNTNTTGTTSTASWSIVGPTPQDNYTGPTTFNVYADNVYGTFAFWSPLTLQNPPTLPTSSPIGVSMAAANGVTCASATNCNFGKVTVGKSSGAITVTLTNASPYQITMLIPPLSFSDLAPDATSGYARVSSFSIGSDLCGGKVLAPGKTCTVRVSFSPRLVNAPNAQQVTYPVNAFLVAAGMEGIPFFTGGTCQTSYCSSVLVTNTVLRVTGPGNESFTRVTGTALPAAATCTGIKPSCDVGATLTPPTKDFPDGATSGTQVYTFKNWASTPTPVVSVELSDTTDYSITSDNCSGHSWASLVSCNFTLVYSAKGTGAINTEVSVSGTVNGTTTTLASAPVAAFAPPPPPPPQINDTQQTNYTCTYIPPPPAPPNPILAYTVYGYVNWTFRDPNQVVHPFNVSTSNWNGVTVANTDCSIVPVVDLTASGTATDGSGYTISIINAVQATVTSPSGQKWKNY